MIRSVLCISLLFAIVATGATTHPATTQSLEQQLAQHKREQHQEYLAEISSDPELTLPHHAISDIFGLSIEKDLIQVHPKLTHTDGQMRCTINGIEGPCTVAVFTEKNVPGGGINALQFAHRDFSNPEEIFRHTMLFAHARSVQLSMDLDGLVRGKSASLIEDFQTDDPDTAVRLNAQIIDSITDDVVGQYNVSAPTFRELRLKYPRETQEFVVPILRDLHSESILAPDAQIAAQVFGGEVKPDEALQKKIGAVLAKFDSDSFQDREQAAKDLAALGQPAAMALRHADRKGWSIDRQSGVDAFLSQYQTMPAEKVTELRKTPIFLLDCLYSDDVNCRASAGKEIEKLTGVSIDASATGDARDAIINQAFSKLFKPLATRPTTQP